MTKIYSDFVCRVMDILYEKDPEGMGAQVSAPRDEYSAEARELARRVGSTNTVKEAEEAVFSYYPEAERELVLGIVAAWRDYRSAIAALES